MSVKYATSRTILLNVLSFYISRKEYVLPHGQVSIQHREGLSSKAVKVRQALPEGTTPLPIPTVIFLSATGNTISLGTLR